MEPKLTDCMLGWCASAYTSATCLHGGSVLSLMWQKFCCDKYIATKHVFCHDKSKLVVTNICCDKHNFVATKILTWQVYFCHDKRHVCCDKIVCFDKYLLRQTHVCCDKHNLFVTKVLSGQAYFCCNKTHILLQQTRVMTKMILMAAPTNDSVHGETFGPQAECFNILSKCSSSASCPLYDHHHHHTHRCWDLSLRAFYWLLHIV